MDHRLNLVFFLVVIYTCFIGHCSANARICWDTTWYNNSSPVNGSEYESLSSSEQAKLCPGSKVIDIRCMDDKFEPFTGHIISALNQFEVNCNVTYGLVCHPVQNASSHASCPDMAIKYGCECLNSTATSVQPPVTYLPTTQNGAKTNQNGVDRGDNNGGNQKQFNLFILSYLFFVLKHLF